MFRKEIIELLAHNPMTLIEIAQVMQQPLKDVEADIQHLQKSLKHTQEHLVVTPARCRKCGFQFRKDKLHKPGKCPQCHGTWIRPPLIAIE
jgi:predicted Zn-ribbon and HTH transcriptional regulator